MGAAVGRPREHDRQAIMDDVCSRLGNGELVCNLAEEYGLQPTKLYDWGALPEFREMYTRARINQAHAMAEQVIKLSDSVAKGDAADAKVKALQVDSRKWLTSKIAHHLYGERLTVDVSNVDVTTLSIEELRELASGKTPQRLLGPGTTG